MMRTKRTVAWFAAFGVLLVLAVPWFLWGTETVVAGLPIWLWWHIGWMGLATAVFYVFTRGAWDRLMGVGPSPAREPTGAEGEKR